MNWETILSWGDSITIGARSYLGYPEYAGHYLSKKTGKSWHTPIHAVCGYTACDLNRSLLPQMSNLKSLSPGFMTLMIGTNDLKGPTDESTFRIAYEQLLIKARMLCATSQILVIKIPRLKIGVMYPYQISMNKTVDRFNAVIEELAEEANIRVLDVQLKNSDLYDGVHLNESGSRQIGKQIAEIMLHDRGLSMLNREPAASITPSDGCDLGIPFDTQIVNSSFELL